MVFFNTKKKLVSTGFDPTTSRSPPKRLIHLSYENIWISSSINLLFICAITRAFPSEPPNVNPDSGTPPRVFYRPVLVLVSLYLRSSSDIVVESLFESSSIIKHQASASSICHHINSTVSNFLLLYYFTCYCNELVIRSVQNADCRLQTGYKMQTRYKMQTADCRLGIKCRLRPKLDINCRLSERNVFNVPQCHAIAFPSLSAAKGFLLGAKRRVYI